MVALIVNGMVWIEWGDAVVVVVAVFVALRKKNKRNFNEF